MRVFEEVSKKHDPELMHPSDKKYKEALGKRNQIAKKQADLLNFIFSVKNYAYKFIDISDG